MSYNAYPKLNQTYSPYYQQSVSQDARPQYTEQPRGNEGYQTNSYQPLSAYQSSQAQQSSSAQSTNTGTAYNETGYGGGALGGRQDSRAGYSDRRSSVDTTALGNLAYASSLGRDNTELQQSMGYNRAHNTAGYSISPSYGINSGNPIQYGTDHQTTDSNYPTATSREGVRARSAISSPLHAYPADSGSPRYQPQHTKPSAVGQAQAQYSGTQFPQSSSESYQASQYSNHSRPSSGQAIHRPTSTTGSHGVSPTVAPAQDIRLSSDGNFRRASTSARSEKPRVPTPQQQPYARTSTGPQIGKHTQNAQSKQVARNSAPLKPAQNGTQTSSKKASTQSSNNIRNSTESQAYDHTSQKSTPTNPQFPTTVDPSQVFNDAEYQRRQAAAAAEAEATKKKAEDARAAALPEDTSSSIPQSAGSDADAARKEQIELEMKQMIEKMRDYKSKDPSLFSQIWEQVKKGQPAQRASPQVTTQGSSASPVVTSDHPPSSVVQLPPESELPAADGEAFPPNLDRGRFPAQRRRRGGASFTPEKKQATPKSSKKSTSGGSNVDGNQAMQRAMGDFHGNSGSSMPPTQTTNPSVQPKEKQHSATPTIKPTAQAGQSAIPIPLLTNKGEVKIPPPKPFGTYWPEHKKQQLADAARIALTTASQNIGKEITTDDIHKLLDQNPSYTQLCEILEYKGFVIDRGQFARLLLSAVPDLGQPSTSRSPAATSTAQHSPPLPTSQAAPPGPMPYSIPQHQQNNQNVPPYGPPHQRGQHPAPQAQMTSASGASRDYNVMDPSNPMGIDQRRHVNVSQQPTREYGGYGLLLPPKPTIDPFKSPVRWEEYNRPATSAQPSSTKQDLARKRSFGEIVDLTQAMSEDEDDEPPSQRPRVDDSTVRVYTAGRSANSGTATPSSVKDTTSLEEFRHKPTGKEAYLRAPNMIRPMNKRQDALRRSSYNPKTIARDILLAIGKHPTMAPLNSHLDVLRDRFTAVNHESDLSTFRWDLVDPGGPPPVQHATVDEDSHQSRRSSGKHVHSRIAVVVGGSRPIEVETGQGRRRNEGFKPTRGGHVSTGTRPSISIPASTNPQTPPNYTASSQDGITRTSLSDSGFSRFVHNDLPVMLNNITATSLGSPSAQLSQASIPASGSVERVKGRRGRPPGAKNRNPRPDRGTAKTPRATPTQHQKTSPEDRATPVPTPSSSLQNRPHISTTPVRPSGLRHAMSPLDGVAVVIPSRSPSIMEGSPAQSVPFSAKKVLPKSMPKNSIQQSPVPSYRVYKCYWDKCPAELHNLDTLKKHVRKHRNEEDMKRGPVPCRWSNCGNGLTSVEAWDKHVAGEHVDTVARESTHSSGDESFEEPSDMRDRP